MKYVWIVLLAWVQTLTAQDLPLLFNKNYEAPSSPYELELVEHVKLSMEKALKLESKLKGTGFAKDASINIWNSDTPSDHLLNNLCNKPGISHLHVGLLRGGSFVAALYGNQDVLKEQIGVDWFLEYPRKDFDANCAPYLSKDKYQIIESGCFEIDKSLITSPVDIYFYDADHSIIGHLNAFTYYDDVFADVFIAVVDDWRCPWVRRPTFKAFEKLGYRILFETFIPDNDVYGHGQYVAVVKKR
jgi:hypothetical protein